MEKRILYLLFFILLLFGCNKQDTTQPIERTKESATKETSEVDSKVGEKDSTTELMKNIEEVVIPETLEQWLKAKPGILVEDDRSEETSGWPFISWDLDDKSKQYLQEVITATQDVDMLSNL